MDEVLRGVWQKTLADGGPLSADQERAADWLGDILDAIAADITTFSKEEVLHNACASFEDRLLLREGFLARCSPEFLSVTASLPSIENSAAGIYLVGAGQGDGTLFKTDHEDDPEFPVAITVGKTTKSFSTRFREYRYSVEDYTALNKQHQRPAIRALAAAKDHQIKFPIADFSCLQAEGMDCGWAFEVLFEAVCMMYLGADIARIFGVDRTKLHQLRATLAHPFPPTDILLCNRSWPLCERHVQGELKWTPAADEVIKHWVTRYNPLPSGTVQIIEDALGDMGMSPTKIAIKNRLAYMRQQLERSGVNLQAVHSLSIKDIVADSEVCALFDQNLHGMAMGGGAILAGHLRRLTGKQCTPTSVNNLLNSRRIALGIGNTARAKAKRQAMANPLAQSKEPAPPSSLPVQLLSQSKPTPDHARRVPVSQSNPQVKANRQLTLTKSNSSQPAKSSVLRRFKQSLHLSQLDEQDLALFDPYLWINKNADGTMDVLARKLSKVSGKEVSADQAKSLLATRRQHLGIGDSKRAKARRDEMLLTSQPLPTPPVPRNSLLALTGFLLPGTTPASSTPSRPLTAGDSKPNSETPVSSSPSLKPHVSDDTATNSDMLSTAVTSSKRKSSSNKRPDGFKQTKLSGFTSS